jgi:hypothetical protein
MYPHVRIGNLHGVHFAERLEIRGELHAESYDCAEVKAKVKGKLSISRQLDPPCMPRKLKVGIH